MKQLTQEQLTAYTQQAEETWGSTQAWKEYEAKNSHRSFEQQRALGTRLMSIFTEFGKLRKLPASDDMVQGKVEELQRFITGHYYNCTDEILKELGELYTTGGVVTENIEEAGGKGTAEFVNRAIQCYICRRAE